MTTAETEPRAKRTRKQAVYLVFKQREQTMHFIDSIETGSHALAAKALAREDGPYMVVLASAVKRFNVANAPTVTPAA